MNNKISPSERYLQIALDFVNLSDALRIVRSVPREKNIIYEVGTPLLKSEGKSAIRLIKEEVGENIVIADTKTLDVGEMEVKIAKIGGADGATVSALAPRKTIEKFLKACERENMISIVDLMGYSGDLSTFLDFSKFVNVFLFHSGIDEGTNIELAMKRIRELRNKFDKNIIAVAGGLTTREIKLLLDLNINVFVVGRYITNSENPEERVREILNVLK